MDICLPELAEPAHELPDTSTQMRPAERWLLFWPSPDSKPADADRATHELCAALPERTIDQARLN